MHISCSAAGVNIPVREDCVVSEPAISFLFPFGKIFNFFKTPETKCKKNAIVTGVASNTFFEKIPEGGVTFLWEKSDIQQWRDKNF
jgi:hypothetical protein